MSPRDAPTDPTAPDLGSMLTSWLEHADLCEVLRKRAQVRGLSGRAGLPRRISSAARRLSGPHVFCELVSRARFGARACYVGLPVDQAAWLFDRVLGGSGQLGIAAAAGALSDAECGVLAHLAAQLCAACSDELAVRDVFSADARTLQAACAGGAVWPLRVAAEGVVFDAKLLFEAPADCPAARSTLVVTVRDELSAETLAALEVDDLLSSDSWPLTCSSRGLEGQVELSAAGLGERLTALLSGRRIAPLERPPPPEEPRAELQLAALPIDFWSLAELASGAPLELPEECLREASLRVSGRAVARGSLALLRGAVALRVHSLFTRDSTR